MQARKDNGKEWVEAFGYDNYLFGARDYYSAIGRFTVVDPFAEKYAHISPYACYHWNPMKYVDLDGKNPVYDLDGNLLGTDENGLQGKPLVMDSKLFTQGMAQDMQKDLM